MTEHEVRVIELAPGESIESYGYEPEDILTATDESYEGYDGYGAKTQDLLKLWVLKEVEEDEG